MDVRRSNKAKIYITSLNFGTTFIYLHSRGDREELSVYIPMADYRWSLESLIYRTNRIGRISLIDPGDASGHE